MNIPGHGTVTPTSLVYDTYKGEWICPICGSDKKYDLSGRWYCASQKAIKYMMDPRNALTEEYVFQFQNLGSAIGDREAVKKMTEGTFLYNDSYINAIMTAATENQVSPFHIVSRIIQEQGQVGDKPYVTGYIYLDKVVYNLFNIGASGGIGEYESGARRAYEEGWFSVEQSIIGGTKFIKEKYINRGQVSLYFQKYNVVEKGNFYQHQYMQNIEAARSEGMRIYKGYQTNGIENSHFNFVIPVYENMPKEACEIPSNSIQSYRGDIANEITSLALEQNQEGEHYIKGEVIVTEWIDGTTWSIPKKTPKMKLKTIEGEYVQDFWVKQLDGSNIYYFDGMVETLDQKQKYIIQIESGSQENISDYRIQSGIYNQNKELGSYRRAKLSIINHHFAFTPIQYYGDIATQITNLSMHQNEFGKTYLAGDILITEWIGSIWTIPDVLPSIFLESIDGTISYEFWVNPIESNQYYFDGYIDGIDMSKEYVFRVKCNNQYNISNNRQVNAYCEDRLSLGKLEEGKVFFENSKLTFEIQTYVGDIATQIQTLSLEQNEQGKHYIKGEIAVTEWIDGSTWSIPKKIPKINIIATDGSVKYECWVNPIGSNRYYFDTYIEGIDISKTYVIEVTSGSSNNISKYKKQTAYYGKEVELGMYQNNIIGYKNEIIYFKPTTYCGDVANEINQITLQEKNNMIILVGQIVITEWINGVTWSVPEKLPIITLINQKREVIQTAKVTNLISNLYQFELEITSLELNESYQIGIQSGSANNISNYAKTTGNFIVQGEIGHHQDKKIMIENQQLIVKQIVEKSERNLIEIEKEEERGNISQKIGQEENLEQEKREEKNSQTNQISKAENKTNQTLEENTLTQEESSL